MIDRRSLVSSVTLGALVPRWAHSHSALEQLRIVVGYPPGGPLDLVGRKLGEKLTPRHARQVLVENKPGAAGRLAVDEVKRARPDGSVVLLTPASVVTMYPHVYRQLAYDPFTDLAPVSPVCEVGFALAVGVRVPDSVTTVETFARWCKAHPTAAQCGNAGAGSMPHLLALLLGRELGLGPGLSHVPYRGGQLAMQAAAAGEVAAALATEGAARTLEQAGRLRVLATSGRERSPFYSAVPTFAEQGLAALTMREWFGVLAPAQTPSSVIQATAGALHAALNETEVRQTWERAALLPHASTPAQLATEMRQEYAFWGSLVKATGFTPEA
ncbi:MAG: tripartite tricarboxylate transporter substrate-binding protein [Burkholderiaceae bacterium]